MRRIFIAVLFLVSASAYGQWLQWGSDSQHSGAARAVGQTPAIIFDDHIYDPFVPAETIDGSGDLLTHYQVPITDGDDVFMEMKSGTYDAFDWRTQTWSLADFRWINGRLVQQWNTATDWKAAPPSDGGGGPDFEPVFHAVVTPNGIFVPGLGGTIVQLDRGTGAVVRRINPFPNIDATIYVAGPLSSDAAGNIYYNAIQFDSQLPYSSDVRGAWLVKVTASGAPTRIAYSAITPGAPRASDQCIGAFTSSPPWPPSPTAVPSSVACGSQRPGLNVAPAIAGDGTIYTVSRAHLNSRYSFLVVVNSDLTPRWMATMRDRFNDGCNVLLPPNGTPGGCRAGALTGVDPSDNTRGAGRVNDNSTSSPVIAPDGSIFYGAFTRYNYAQGHMLHFSAAGEYLGGYRFGWDITPAVFAHGQTYSLITKENHYSELGSYCDDLSVCPAGRTPSDPEQYLITSLSPSFGVEWQFKSTNTLSCTRVPTEGMTCVSDHPNGFEWCVNAPAVDANGTTYANSEDGFLYAIDSSGHQVGSIFLQLAIGAAYTPVSIDEKGRIYTQNAGHLFAVGAITPEKRRSVRH